MPTMNAGRDRDTVQSPSSPVSTTPRGWRAAQSAPGTAKTTDSSTPRNVSSNVGGSLVRISDETGNWL